MTGASFTVTGEDKGWNLVTSGSDAEARNFGLEQQIANAERYVRVEEYVGRYSLGDGTVVGAHGLSVANGTAATSPSITPFVATDQGAA